MLRMYKYNNLIDFSADVFMCEHRTANNGLNCWELRLLVQGELIDAYHWYPAREHKINYREKDTVLVVGNWATRHKQRFQIIRAEVISYLPANDELFNCNESHQTKLILDTTPKVNAKDV